MNIFFIKNLLYSFAIIENINNTGIDFFGVFDGHGGDFSVLYLMKNLLLQLLKKILDAKQLSTNSKMMKNSSELAECHHPVPNVKTFNLTEQSLEFQKFHKYAVECLNRTQCVNTETEFLPKIAKVVLESKHIEYYQQILDSPSPKTYPAKCYIDNIGQVNYGQLIIDELLNFDHTLVKELIPVVMALIFQKLT